MLECKLPKGASTQVSACRPIRFSEEDGTLQFYKLESPLAKMGFVLCARLRSNRTSGFEEEVYRQTQADIELKKRSL